MKLHTKILLALLLLVLPIAGRWLWFQRGWYSPPAIAEVDSDQIAPASLDYQPATDEPQPGNGRVLLDLSHTNNLEVNDLAPLRDRLEARGVVVDTFEGNAETSLENHLRGTTALVVLAPTSPYLPEERQAIKAFVEDGGRLLMAADPTRPVPVPPEELDLFTLFFPTSSTPAVNSLANVFGVIYFDDYLYNLVDNEGNYRNVKFTNLNQESPLTQDLETLVLFASHSLRSEGSALISGDEDTLSPSRSGETNLVVAALAADEHVLALGDVTFLTPPYHTVADNDRFLSHIADWLAGAERQRELKDFPFLFTGPVDMVQMTGDFLDPRLIASSSTLQEMFEQADLTLSLRAEAEPDHSALFVGTFDETELIEDYLQTAGVTITLTLTETETITPSAEAESTAEPTATPEATVEATEELTAALTTETEPTAETEDEEEIESRGSVEVEGLGALRIEGASLFIVNREAERVVVIALAEDGEAVTAALDRLVAGDLSGCIQGDSVTLCSNGEAQDGAGLDVGGGDETSPAEDGQDRIFILSDDDGPEGQRTGAAELEAILSETYEVTVWSTSQDGLPADTDIAGYEAYIIDSGDYAYDTEDIETLSPFFNLQEGDVMFIGEQPFPSFTTDPAEINDLEIADAAHPLATGFTGGETITLLPSESGVPAIVIPDTPETFGESDIVFIRGPDSPEAGNPAVIAAVDEQTNGRIILAGFAFYRLPEEAQRTFALNAVGWLVGE